MIKHATIASSKSSEIPTIKTVPPIPSSPSWVAFPERANTSWGTSAPGPPARRSGLSGTRAAPLMRPLRRCRRQTPRPATRGPRAQLRRLKAGRPRTKKRTEWYRSAGAAESCARTYGKVTCGNGGRPRSYIHIYRTVNVEMAEAAVKKTHRPPALLLCLKYL